AAVVIGGGSLSGGEGSIFGSVVGALIMAFLRNGCQQMGWPNYIQEIIIGGIIVLAVALDRLRAGWAAAWLRIGQLRVAGCGLRVRRASFNSGIQTPESAMGRGGGGADNRVPGALLGPRRAAL